MIRLDKNYKRGSYQTLRRQLYHCSTDSKKIRKSGHCSRYQRRNRVSKIGGLWFFGSRNQQLLIHESEESEALKIIQKAIADMGL